MILVRGAVPGGREARAVEEGGEHAKIGGKMGGGTNEMIVLYGGRQDRSTTRSWTLGRSTLKHARGRESPTMPMKNDFTAVIFECAGEGSEIIDLGMSKKSRRGFSPLANRPCFDLYVEHTAFSLDPQRTNFFFPP